MFTDYVRQRGAEPSEDIEPTLEQVSTSHQEPAQARDAQSHTFATDLPFCAFVGACTPEGSEAQDAAT